jgi:hypothetical protein
MGAAMGTRRTAVWNGVRGWSTEVTAGVVGGVVASFIVLFVLAWQANMVAERTLRANPTCSTPAGLEPVRVASVSASSVFPADGDAYDAANAIDSSGESLWIPQVLTADEQQADEGDQQPPVFDPSGDDNELTLDLGDRERKVRLVCVVNGSALWFTSYQNWGRVRTVAVWGDHEDDADVEVLQVAARNLGRTNVVHIALVDAYAVQRVETFNPAVAWAEGVRPRYTPGCILDPKRKAGLAEVYIYAEP